MMREIDVRVHWSRESARHDAKRYALTIAHGPIIERRSLVPYVFVAWSHE
jgi:membrane protein YdbS with pleckstrin-like domain